MNLTGRDGHCVVDNSWVVGRWGGGGGRESAKRNIQNLPRLSRLVNVLLMEKRNSAVFSALLHVSKVTSLGGGGSRVGGGVSLISFSSSRTEGDVAPMGIYVCAIFGEFKAIFDLVTRTQKKEGEKKKWRNGLLPRFLCHVGSWGKLFVCGCARKNPCSPRRFLSWRRCVRLSSWGDGGAPSGCVLRRARCEPARERKMSFCGAAVNLI